MDMLPCTSCFEKNESDGSMTDSMTFANGTMITVNGDVATMKTKNGEPISFLSGFSCGILSPEFEHEASAIALRRKNSGNGQTAFDIVDAKQQLMYRDWLYTGFSEVWRVIVEPSNHCIIIELFNADRFIIMGAWEE